MSMKKTSMADGIYRPKDVNDPRVPRLHQQNIEDSEELRSVPFADYSYDLYVPPPLFTESYLTDSRSLFDEEPQNGIGSNTPADIFNDQAGSSHEEQYADHVNVGTNALDGDPFDVPCHAFNGTLHAARRAAPVKFERNEAIYQQHIPLVKRRQWNDPPTPPLDTWLPEVLQEEVEQAAAATEHQHELEYMEVHKYPSFPEGEFYPNVDTWQADGILASNYLFLATIQYASYRVAKFRDHGEYLTGRINIAGFQHRQMCIWNDERFMVFSLDIFDNNDTCEVQYCNSGTIEFPCWIRRETFACWYDPYQPFLCFRAIYL